MIGQVADAGVADVRAAIDAADAAFGEWSTRTAYERSAYLVPGAPAACSSAARRWPS